ncbi:N-methyl-L-tryptophan oxidase [Brevibacillus reuszeri]|uniref:N-methyl-L-tryptophan oxidase n=1 Tax=Brevibacillus reuszeri TaxID=54915 RepID=UPI001B081327|nr:N-methyl-L-tryptophan oxidase [Brevibacillus reuszeri]GIO05986.1 N-methyl-L-tryptophan oxidase [Brevibacillus reuszeri]
MSRIYDVIVVGAGSMGISAGYQLAKRGIRTLLIDSFDPPHQQGSHHGDTRLIRHAYSGGSTYITLALQADQLWRELEELSQTQLLVRSGVINLADNVRLSFRDRIKDATRLGVKVERLEAAEITNRWPGFRLPESFEGMYEPDAGFLFSEKCIAAYRSLALAEGAEILVHTPVEEIFVQGAGVSVKTHSGHYFASQLIISAGAWLNTLEPFVALPVRAVRKTVGWFRAEPRLFDQAVFPGFTLATEHGGYYGFPSIQGTGLKIGRHDGGQTWRPGEKLEPFGALAEDETDLRNTLEEYMPHAAGGLLNGGACRYELTPDENFIIDRHPNYTNVLVAGGFSGHGFKFSSAVGVILADLIENRKPAVELEPFSISRFDAITT